MRVGRSAAAVSAFFFFFAALALGQQWSGPNNTTGEINRTGNVGLGVSNPQDQLHLFRNSASTTGILMGNSIVPSGRHGFLVDYHASGGAELWNFENTAMWFGTNGTKRMTIGKDGRVGIATEAHTFGFDFDDDLKLDVQGMLRVKSVDVWDGPGEYDLTWAKGCHEPDFSTVCGYLEGTRIITREGSSSRYKQNIRPVRAEDAAKILTAQAMQYEPKEHHGPKGFTTVGYIAEDLEKAGLTDLVIYDEERKPDGVKYKKVAVYLTEVVKSQQKAIEQLQKEMAELRRHMESAPKK
jgi:hypothetical protein